MTEEIIIDGVDISECSNYNPEQYFECEISSCHCEEITNCYFKQLKRTEQKLDKIKGILEVIIEQCKIYPLKNNLIKILQIIEDKQNEQNKM